MTVRQLLASASLQWVCYTAAERLFWQRDSATTREIQETSTMIDFELTDEQQAMRDLAHTFAEQEIRPVAAELDEREEFPWELVKKAGELGLTTFAFPEELGGLGITDELTNCIITEELPGAARASPPCLGAHIWQASRFCSRAATSRSNACSSLSSSAMASARWR